jgi:hypothetical protein
VTRGPPCCIPVRMKDSLVGMVSPPCVVVYVAQCAGVVPEALIHLVPRPVTLQEGAAVERGGGGVSGSGGKGHEQGRAKRQARERGGVGGKQH